MKLKRLLGAATLSNQLTFLRLVAVPFFIIAVLDARFGWALVLFLMAGVTDLLDGLTARWLKQGTPLGAYLDPAADKILMTAAFLLLTDYPSMFQTIPMVNRLPVALTILAISRDVFIVIIALMMYLAYGRTHFPPTFLGKVTTVAELMTIAVFLLFNWLGRFHPVLAVAVWTTLGLILLSGFHYLWRAILTVRVEGTDSTSPGRPT